MFLQLFTISLFAIYSFLILYYWQAWIRIPLHETGDTRDPVTVTLIIPARNEEENIAALLNSLMQQTYAREFLEIIVVNDHSTDRTAEITKQFEGVRLINMDEEINNAHKKAAIAKAIAESTGELIICTDADCIAGPDWINNMVSFWQQEQVVFIAAPVKFIDEKKERHSWLMQFQSLDFLVLQGITGAAVYTGMLSMCNGANLCYRRSAYTAVNGFEGIDHIASGDDMLLMHKINLRFPGSTRYLKSRQAIIETRAANSWKEFFNQRIRWASKASQYKDPKIFIVLLLVYLFNLCFPVLLIAGFFNSFYWWYAAGFIIAKTLVELPFVFAVAGFFRQRHLLKNFFFFQPAHIFYTIVAGGLGQFGQYEWKGRRVK